MKRRIKQQTDRSRENDERGISSGKIRWRQVHRKREIFAKRRKNFLPALVLAITGWLGWSVYVRQVSPANGLRISMFLVIFFSAVFLTTSLLWGNSRRGCLTATGLTGYLFFRYHDLANALNLFILVSLLISIELYFVQRR